SPCATGSVGSRRWAWARQDTAACHIPAEDNLAAVWRVAHSRVGRDSLAAVWRVAHSRVGRDTAGTATDIVAAAERPSHSRDIVAAARRVERRSRGRVAAADTKDTMTGAECRSRAPAVDLA